MMAREEVMAILASAGADLDVIVSEDVVRVIVQDFEDFDEDWCEVYREYDEDLLDSIQETLEEGASSVEGDYYVDYYFDGFVVRWGYASMDI